MKTDKYAPRKCSMSPSNLKLSSKQIERIKYEASLLGLALDEVYLLIPYMFNEGILHNNTHVKDEFEKLDANSKQVEDLEDYSGYL